MKSEVSRFVLFLFIIVFPASNLLAQQLGSIEGKVYETKTSVSLPGASVYLASTTIGVASDANGAFLLENITNGKYDLIVSMIGYKTFSKSFIINGNSIKDLVIYLDEETIELSTVKVEAKRLHKSAEFVDFERWFIGTTQNARHCQIVNGYDVEVISNGSSIAARAQKPIEIINNALGYRVFYLLKQFAVDKSRKVMTLSGIARFESLVPENEKQERRWIRERDRAYFGSAEHFIRSLKNKKLKENGFKLLHWASADEWDESRLFSNNLDSAISFQGKVRVVFLGELAEISYDPKRGLEESTLESNGNRITLFDNGNFDPFQDLKLLGYFGWTSGVAELMPLGYQPKSKLKF